LDNVVPINQEDVLLDMVHEEVVVVVVLMDEIAEIDSVVVVEALAIRVVAEVEVDRLYEGEAILVLEVHHPDDVHHFLAVNLQ